jgi:hypothetical protein
MQRLLVLEFLHKQLADKWDNGHSKSIHAEDIIEFHWFYIHYSSGT